MSFFLNQVRKNRSDFGQLFSKLCATIFVKKMIFWFKKKGVAIVVRGYFWKYGPGFGHFGNSFGRLVLGRKMSVLS